MANVVIEEEEGPLEALARLLVQLEATLSMSQWSLDENGSIPVKLIRPHIVSTEAKTFRSAAKVSEMKAKDEVCTLHLSRTDLRCAGGIPKIVMHGAPH